MAHEKHGKGSMLYGSDDRSLRILVEEVGECARELNELALGNGAEDYDNRLYAELVQVGAMAATWAEKVKRRNPP